MTMSFLHLWIFVCLVCLFSNNFCSIKIINYRYSKNTINMAASIPQPSPAYKAVCEAEKDKYIIIIYNFADLEEILDGDLFMSIP